METGGDKAAMFETIERARAGFAELVHAETDEVALIKNISDGVNAFATAIPWQAGDSVVLCSELEHPANLLPWHNLVHQHGVRIISVAADWGSIPVEKMIDAMDERTRVMAVSSVSFAPGFATALDLLGAACRTRGVYLMVDAAQSAGILATDVNAAKVDVLIASTQKGLLGLYGMGFMYMRRDLAESLTPAYLSRLGVVLDGTHEAASAGIENFRYAAGTRRFDVGNYNYLAATAADRSIQALLALGSAEIEAHTSNLAAELREGLAALDLPILTPPSNSAHAAHIVAVGAALVDKHDQVDDPMLGSLNHFFVGRNVIHSMRRGVLRLSLHAYNDASDISRTIEATRDWRKIL
jgi:cysteine desulfurase/selenocysteine lyase